VIGRFSVGALLIFGLSGRVGAQMSLGRDWLRVRDDQPVFANLDSIQRIGPDFYRAVLIFDEFPGIRDIRTEEVRCTDHAARTIHQITMGRGATGPMAQNRRTPEAPFVKLAPGDTAEAQYLKICQMGQKKFAAAAKSPGR
jgi:hypothetical protein